MSAAPHDTDTGNVRALRVLLAERRALFPALRRDDWTMETFAEYQHLTAQIDHIRVRIGEARYRAIKGESDAILD